MAMLQANSSAPTIMHNHYQVSSQANSSAPTIIHNHYHYSFKFNDISLSSMRIECSLEGQRQRKSTGTWFSDLIEQGIYLAHCSEKCFITADTVDSKRASDAVVSRNFNCSSVILEELLPLSRSTTFDKYITEKHLLEVLHLKVTSACTVDEEFEEVIQHLDAIVYKNLDETLGHNDSTQVVMSIGSELKELQKNIKEKKEQLTKLTSYLYTIIISSY